MSPASSTRYAIWAFEPSSSRTSPTPASWNASPTRRGAGIGGTLYPGALSGPDGPAPNYLDMMRHNATTIAQALTSEDS